ncbi:MAG: hypothetical protein JXB00_13580 [Bacteroidales bacterium]|nr:hypothetical protein [Bacteroidales bacterium]
MKLNTGFFFISDFDPIYAFLLNGLSLAEGTPGTGIAGFPGTTMQAFIAAVIHLGHIFRPEEPLARSVLLNPEYYLNIAAIAIGFINATVFYLTGLTLFKNTGRYDVSLFLQLTSFASVFGFSYGIFIMCEPFVILATQIIMLQAAIHFFNKKTEFSLSQLIALGIAAAFGISTKIIFFPVFLFIFLILKGFKQKLKFLLVFILSLGFFLIPIYNDFPEFLEWFKLIFFHTRLYGDGDTGIVDPQFMSDNIQTIITENPVLILAIIVLLVFQSLRLFKQQWKKIEPEHRRAMNAISVAVGIGLLMFSKHYKPYYMGFFHGFALLPVLLFVDIFLKKIINCKFKCNRTCPVILPFFTGLFLIVFLVLKLDESLIRRNNFRNSVNEIRAIAGNNPGIMVVHSGSTAFEEGGISFGLQYSHRREGDYRELLRNIYPSVYFFSPYDDLFFDWQNVYSLSEILSMHPTVFLFSRSEQDTLSPFLRHELNVLSNSGLVFSYKKVFGTEGSFGQLFKIVSDTSVTKRMNLRNDTIKCNCEIISNDGISVLSVDGKCNFSKPQMLTNIDAFNGKMSAKLTGDMPFALDIKIKAGCKDVIKASAWRKSSDKKGYIVLDAQCENIYKASGTVVETCNGWEKISFSLRLPQSFQGNEVLLYIWYNGTGTCYFDDFEIIRLDWDCNEGTE